MYIDIYPMNYFDELFFQKYLRTDEELVFVCHRHPILIVDRIIVTLFFGLMIPTFFYYNNILAFQDILPFLYFETFILGLYCFLIYKIFDWYNDVWIITSLGIIDIDWDIFTRHTIYIDYSDIKGAEIQTSSLWDAAFHKWDVVLYTAGDRDDFILHGAEHPDDILDHVEEVLHERAKHKDKKEKAPMELLLHTLTEVVREHLEWGGSSYDGHGKHTLLPSEKEREEQEKEEEIEKFLAKKWTIDLR